MAASDLHVTIVGTRATDKLVAAFAGLEGWTVQSLGPTGGALPPAWTPRKEQWEALRSEHGLATRYNNPLHFERALLESPRTEQEPLAVLLEQDEKLSAVISGRLEARPMYPGPGPISAAAPKLTGLSISETAIVTDGLRSSAEGVSRFLLTLLHQKACSVIDVANLPRIDPVHSALLASVAPSSRMVVTETVRWRRQLLDDAGKPLQHGSKKTRYKLRRTQKLLSEQFAHGIELRRVEKPEEMADFAKKAAAIVAQTYQASLGIGVKDTPEYRAFLEEIAREGRLRGYLLEASGEALAYGVGDLEAGTFHLWATSFVPRYAQFSPGTVLLHQVFDDLIAEGVPLFDFGWGDAQYKRAFGSESLTEDSLRIYGEGALAHLGRWADVTYTRARKHVHESLRSMGALDRARRAWRTLIQPSSG